jgi:hypothetical protein
MLDEVLVEVRFPVSPPESIPLPEHDSVFINWAGRLNAEIFGLVANVLRGRDYPSTDAIFMLC